MRRLAGWARRLAGTLSPRRRDDDFAAEIESHLQLHVDDNLRAGMSPDEARRRAVLQLGGVEAVREAQRDQARVPWLAAAFRDVRFGVRMLRRQPGFALAAIATLALGIGANAAVFGIVDALLLRPLPYAAPDRIVEITGPGQGFARFGPVTEIFPPALRQSPGFASMALYIAGGVNLGGEPAARVAAAAISPEFFDVLGVRSARGRVFTADDIAASGRVVVISDRLWRSRHHRDPDIVGTTITIDGNPFTVLGVMPPDVSFPDGAQVWMPTNAPTGVKGSIPTVKLIARLRDGVPVTTARDLVIAAAGERATRGPGPLVLPMREALAGGIRPIAVAIWIAAGLVLLVACINATNLLLARVMRRRHEFAVRRALGATRGRLAFQVALESLVLSALGAAAAIPAAAWTIGAAQAMLPATWHGVADMALGARTLAAIGGLTMLTTALFGLAPALSIRSGALELLRVAVPAGADRRWRHFRNVLLVAEIAIALVLLAGAATLVRSVQAVMRIDVGASGERALAMELLLPRGKYPKQSDHVAFFDRLVPTLRNLPGVEAVGITNQLPGRAQAMLLARNAVLEGEARPASDLFPTLLSASPGYFAAAGIEVIAGREFVDRDLTVAEPGVIVSERVARRFGIEPAALVGRRLVPDSNDQKTPDTIVGVVRDVRLRGPESDFEMAIYAPRNTLVGPVSVVVRAARDPRALLPAVRAAVAGLDPDLPLYNIQTFDDIRAALLFDRRLAMLTMIGFATLTFVLAAIGLYSVISYLVQLRMREIGIRLAIGATRAAISRDVLRQGAWLAIAGVVLGGIAALTVVRAAAAAIPGMQTTPAATLAVLGAGVIAVALMATLIPAWRASRIDPLLTLRAE